MLARHPILGRVVCPCCREPIDDLAECHACKTAFRHGDGPPSLIPVTARREVRFLFTAERSIAGEDFRNAFRYPPIAGAAAANPYHLDAAHAALLDALPAGSSVLELGCGGGQMREHLRAKGIDYIGTDISAGERVVESLRASGGPDLLCDAHFLPFADNQFDFVYTSALVEHLASPFAAAQEAYRVLKPGGRFVGSVSFLEPWHDDSFFHMTPLGVFELLTQAGFSAEYIWPGLGYSGFNALHDMGNRASRTARLLGRLSTAIYRAGNRMKRAGIRGDAVTSGSTDWIAVKGS